MAWNAAFPCHKPVQIFHHNPTNSIHAGLLTLRGRNFLQGGPVGLPKGRVFWCRNERKHLVNNPGKPNLIVALAATSDSSSGEISPTDAIKKFYRCINNKDLKQLEDFIDRNCLLEDSFFPYQFQGKKEVMSFFTQLVESMGENAQFRIGHICEGEELTATVDWHMEWEEDQLPFSRGCSIFQFLKEEDRLVIRKAQFITEPPIKPGKLAMALLKILTSLFDDFPKEAKWLLHSQQQIFKAVVTIYNLFLAPILNPVLGFYYTLWKFIARLFGYVISFLHIIAKFFGKKSPNNHRSFDQRPTKFDSASDDLNSKTE